MTTALQRELELRMGRSAAGAWWNDPEHVDPFAECHHRPDQTYTRKPCSCGRPLWPPRGRGRGESLSSPRRIAAKLRALEALELHIQGLTYAAVARRLGYRHRASAWNAVQRLRDESAAWRNFEARTSYRARKPEPTQDELEHVLAKLHEEMAGGGLDQKRLHDAQRRLRRLLVTHSKKGA